MSNSTSTEASVPTSSPTSQAPISSTTSLPRPSSSSSSLISSTTPSSTSANPSPSSAPSTSFTSSSESSTLPTSLTSTSTIQTTTQVPTTPPTPTQPTTSARPTTTEQPPTTQAPTSSPPPLTTITNDGSTRTIVLTSTAQPTISQVSSITSSSSSTSASSTAGLQSGAGGSGSSGLSKGGVVAVAVVVPIVAVTLLVLAALFLWRKRKARKDAEELRRKEVEEYGYNPNNDPTLPAVAGGSAGHDGPFEMREDGSSGYRGWGTTTVVGSTGRKASTTISGGQSAGGIGMAYSEGTSPTQGPTSDTRSDNPLVGEGHPGETEALGAMGPASSANRNGEINRGPSNASSSYSAAGRSDGSGEMGGYGGGYNQYDAVGNPYNGETPYGSPPGRAEMGGQPVIRDVQARRNTRIENPAHFPQQSAGISQNF